MKCDPVRHRILWNAGKEVVDEIVVSDCMAHLEELDVGRWYLALYPTDQPDERVMVHISGTVSVSEEIAWDEVDEHAPYDDELDVSTEKESPWDRDHRLGEEARERSFALAERQLVAQEKLAEAVGGAPALEYGPGAFFSLGEDQQEFELRRVAIAIAAQLDGGVRAAKQNANEIIRYIQTGF